MYPVIDESVVRKINQAAAADPSDEDTLPEAGEELEDEGYWDDYSEDEDDDLFDSYDDEECYDDSEDSSLDD